jgi:hypothetical protein
MPERSLYWVWFHIDTNRINSSGQLDSMNQLEAWAREGVINIDMSAVAQQEAVGRGSGRRAEKAHSYIFSETLANTPDEQEEMRQIEQILFPAGVNNQNQRNDVEIVFNALKYTRILVTNDGDSKSQPGGILGHATELKALGIRVMRDSEAVLYVRDLLSERDEMAREVADRTGEPLPHWVGKD